MQNQRTVISIGVISLLVLFLWLALWSLLNSPPPPSTAVKSVASTQPTASATRPSNQAVIMDDVSELRKDVIAQAESNDSHAYRINSFVATLRKESLEDSAALLSEASPYYYPGAYSPAKLAQLDLETMLSNRRVVKLLADLKALPPIQARQKVGEIFHREFTSLRDTGEYVAKTYEDARLPRNTKSLLANKMALCAALFFVSQVGDPNDVPKFLGEVEALEHRIDERVAGLRGAPDILPQAMQMFVHLDERFKANILILAAMRLPADSITRSGVQKLAGGIKVGAVTLTPFDAAITTFDFAHVHRGEVIDQSKGAWELSAFQWADSQADANEQRELVKQMMAEFRPTPVKSQSP